MGFELKLRGLTQGPGFLHYREDRSLKSECGAKQGPGVRTGLEFWLHTYWLYGFGQITCTLFLSLIHEVGMDDDIDVIKSC